jgi:hypothetical protein
MGEKEILAAIERLSGKADSLNHELVSLYSVIQNNKEEIEKIKAEIEKDKVTNIKKKLEKLKAQIQKNKR